MSIETKPKLLELARKSTSYKLIVTPELEQKIRYFLDKFPSIEYSGTLFYTVSGSFETEDLVITAFDFLLQDIGVSGYTEFNQSPDVIGYMVDHPELLGEDIYQGLMHSHHTMGAFFSGTDLATLREEGSDRIHFVSLIIDTKGTYKAAITRVVSEEMTATGYVKYPTYNGKESIGQPVSYSFTRKKLEYFMLDVEIPVIANPFKELADRILEVQKQKEEAKKKAIPVYGGSWQGGSGYNSYSPRVYNYTTKQWEDTKPSTPKNTAFNYQTNVGRGNVIPENKPYVPSVVTPPVQEELPFEQETQEEVIPPYGEVKVDPTIIEEIARQLVTGDISYGVYENETLEELAKIGEESYAQRFEDDSLFHAWAEGYVEFLVYYAEDPALEQYEDDVLAALVAYDLVEKLNKLTNRGKYINQFIEMIERYII